MPRLRPLLAACLVAVAAGAGGGSEQLVAEGYQRKVNEIVVHAQSTVPGDLDPSSADLPALATRLDDASAAFDDAHNDVEGLKPPPELEDEDGELQGALLAMRDALQATADDARTADQTGVLEDVGRLANALERLTRVNLAITQAARGGAESS